MKPSMLIGVEQLSGRPRFQLSGHTYTKREKVLDLGLIEATPEKRESIPLVTGAAVVGALP